MPQFVQLVVAPFVTARPVDVVVDFGKEQGQEGLEVVFQRFSPGGIEVGHDAFLRLEDSQPFAPCQRSQKASCSRAGAFGEPAALAAELGLGYD